MPDPVSGGARTLEMDIHPYRLRFEITQQNLFESRIALVPMLLEAFRDRALNVFASAAVAF
jgi:hypothetical protein